jgi:hypothetical protein
MGTDSLAPLRNYHGGETPKKESLIGILGYFLSVEGLGGAK